MNKPKYLETFRKYDSNIVKKVINCNTGCPKWSTVRHLTYPIVKS